MSALEVLILVTWFACGYLAAGFDFARSEDLSVVDNSWKYKGGLVLFFVVWLLGPLGLFAVMALGRTNYRRRYPWQSSRWKL